MVVISITDPKESGVYFFISSEASEIFILVISEGNILFNAPIFVPFNEPLITIMASGMADESALLLPRKMILFSDSRYG
jgi:hypothetical protein